jgi:NAD(P)-dependent dehydrogenase (short-subunit alcohol dehydrogenase family)
MEWGALNVLVNNAVLMSGAGPSGKRFEDLPIERWQDTLRCNLEGIVLTINCVLPLMRQAGWGRIVSISSDAVDGWVCSTRANSAAAMRGIRGSVGRFMTARVTERLRAFSINSGRNLGSWTHSAEEAKG